MSIKLLYILLIDKLSRVINMGQEAGIFRAGIDMNNLYISISALGYFYFYNMHSMGIVLEEDFGKKKSILKQRKLVVDMVSAYLKA